MPWSPGAGPRVSGEHAVDREVLADVAEELEDRDARPVEVVDQRAGGALEVEEALHLTRIRRTQPATTSSSFSVRSFARGSPIRPVPPPTRATAGDRPAGTARISGTRLPTCRLGGRRVEAVVQDDRSGCQFGTQCVEVGAVGDQAAPGQLVDDCGHGVILPHTRAHHSSRSVCPSSSSR